MISIGTTFNYDIPLKNQLPTVRRADFTDYRKRNLVKQVYRLLEYIGEKDLRLAVENLRASANDILSYSLDRIVNLRYGLCYDSSHDNLTAHPMAILKKYGHRLITTHISDNHGEKDDHILPFEGPYRWDEFCKLFAEIDFIDIFLL